MSIDGNDVVTAYMLENSAIGKLIYYYLLLSIIILFLLLLLFIGTVLVDFHATDSNGGSITWSLNDAQFAISSPPMSGLFTKV